MITSAPNIGPDTSNGTRYLIILFLVVATLAVYWQIGNNEFVSYDDRNYVTENLHVATGLTSENIHWAFTTTEMGNWHPLTWLSHMVDCQLYGLNPRGHHLTSVFLHIANTVLLFLLLSRITNTLWRSAFAAALFALHPLHVESVAWVAERKDVLSTLFFMLTLLAYARYVEHPKPARYLVVVVTYALGLMSKPMLVTLPFVLLLLDYWPLDRLSSVQGDDSKSRQALALFTGKSPVSGLLIEKIPLLTLSVAMSIVSYLAQNDAEALVYGTDYPLPLRLANAVVAYANYILKAVWPENLAVMYPLPAQVPLRQVGGALALLGLVSLVAIWRARRYPFFIVGWLWFLGTLVPVIGFIQVGRQAMADRYTYIPYIGLFIMIAWGSAELSQGWRYRSIFLRAAGTVIIVLLTVVTWLQLGYWNNSFKLFTHTLHVTRDNYVAYKALGDFFSEKGNVEEAIVQYNQALRFVPKFGYPNAHNNLGNVLIKLGRLEDAVSHFEEAIREKPDDVNSHMNLGIALTLQKKSGEAIYHFSEAIRLDPNDADAHYNFGVVLAMMGRFEEAVDHYSKALLINPADAEVRRSMGFALAELEKKRSIKR